MLVSKISFPCCMDKMRPLFVAILASCTISWMVYSVVWIVVTVSSPTYRWMTVPSEWPDKITDYSFLQTLKPFGNDAMQEGRGAEGDIFLVQTNIIMLSMSDARQSDHRKEMRTIWARKANRVNTKRQKSARAPTIESQYDLPVWHMFMCGFILPGGEQHRKKPILVTSPGRLQASGCKQAAATTRLDLLVQSIGRRLTLRSYRPLQQHNPLPPPRTHPRHRHRYFDTEVLTLPTDNLGSNSFCSVCPVVRCVRRSGSKIYSTIRRMSRLFISSFSMK